ncbi:predicted protein [Nematostella vectensis]|uniref:PAS domain-containing protein n=1 Tax=Nematostella vectensis TaxID=45351 RepID=A7RKQ2_NEMVE|nr:predicted protein [Nematostella vectensis]|eukprot:XP_001640010.1 predicted protein [Nematostella vectensis]
MSKTASILKSIKESTKGYTCKLDLSFKNMRLDNRGLRNLHLTEKDVNGLSAYFFFHPGDVEIMSLAHERIIAEGSSLSAFRAIDGKGHIVWVRGRASAVFGASGKLDGFLTENILLSEEEGRYYRKLYFRELKEWKNKSASCSECFKFFGRTKPLSDKKSGPESYALFAVCTPMSKTASILKSIKESTKGYTCKLDLSFKNMRLDNRGLRNLHLTEKDINGLSAYFFYHPGDVEIMSLAHERIIAEGSSLSAFRAIDGKGHIVWVRGRASAVFGASGKLDGFLTENILLSEEEGKYYRKLYFRELKEWKNKSASCLEVSSEGGLSPCLPPGELGCLQICANSDGNLTITPVKTCIAKVPHRNVTSPHSTSPDWTCKGIAKVPHRNAASCSVVFKAAEDTKPSHHLRHWPQQSSGETRIANAICPANPSIPTSSYNPVIKGVGQSEMCNGQSNDMLRSWRTRPNGIHGFAPSTCSTAELPCIGVNGNISYGHPPCNDGIREWNTVPTIEASDPVDAYLSNFENLEQMINGLRSLLPPRAYEDEFEDDIKGSSRDHGMGLTTIENPPRKSGMFANVSNQQFGAGTLAELESIRLEELKSLWNQGDSYKPEDNSGSVAFQTSPSPLPGQKDMFGPPWEDGPSFDPGLLNGGYTMREFSSQVRNLNNGFSGLSSPFDAVNRS